METTTINQFYIIGITVRTSNESGRAAQDIPALWNKFISENLASKIPGRTDNDIYCIYTDYEKDHTRPYTTLLGCRVKDLSSIPEGFTGKSIETAVYKKFTAMGKLSDNIVFDEWTRIWNTSLPRTYTSDFEVYSPDSLNPENATVPVFIAVA